MRRSLRRGLAALLALVLVLGTYPTAAVAASLDEADISGAVLQEEEAAPTEEADEPIESEEATGNGETIVDGGNADPETQEPTEEEADSAGTDESSEETEAADPAEDETETVSGAEETSTEKGDAADEEAEGAAEQDGTAEEAETAVEAASTTRTAAYKRSYAKKGTTFRILVIGNSFSADTTRYLYNVASAAGYDVEVGNLYRSNLTLANHWSYAKNKSAVYTYRKNSTGSWETIASKSATMAQAVEDEEWDIIFFQQASVPAGVSSSFSNSSGDNYLTLLSDYVTGLCGNDNVKIGYLMTWAHIDGSDDNDCVAKFDGDQMAMYNAICSVTKKKVAASGAVDLIAPVGTAIQNVRSSYIGDTLNRDNEHLSYGLGRWLAAMSLASACGMDLSGVTAIKSSSSYGLYSSLHLEVLKQAIADAEKTPYAVTALDTELPTLSNPEVTTSTSDTKLTLTWSAVSGATGYEVYQLATGESDYTLVKTLSRGKSSYSYTGSADYGYYVCALGDDYIAATASNTVGTFGSVALARPSISSVGNASNGGLTIRWSTVTGAAGYQVQTATDSSFTKNVQTATVTGTSKTTSSRTSGTKYYVRVRAYKTVSGTKNYSAWSTVKSTYCVNAPTLSSVSNASSRKLTVKWKTVSSVTGYQVQIATDSSFTKNVQTTTSTSASKTTSSLTNGTKYYVRVRAYKTVSGTKYYSAWSSKKSIYCLSAPSISSLKNVKTRKMTVKWGKNSKATGYQIQYSTSSSFKSYKTVTVSSYKTVKKTISKLTKGKKYYVRVRAYKTVSGTKYYSAWSSKKSVKISK